MCVFAFALSTQAVQADPAHRERGPARGAGHAVVVAPRLARTIGVARPVWHAPVVRVAPTLRYRPVYRPGLSIGIYIGSPYRYPYPYAYRYVHRFPYRYGYAYPSPYPSPYLYAVPPAVYAVPPAGAVYGGVRLQVTPNDAMVYVDGYYVGTVDDFDGSLQRVALEPVPHHFEIQAPGYMTIAFDVNVRPNQTITYRADMQRVLP
jgi:hypothetical protein